MKEGWTYKKLGAVSSFQNGFAFKSNLFRKEGHPIVRISNIQDEEILTDDIVYFNKEDYPVNFDNYKIYPNDILIAMSGGTTGKLGINTTNTIFYQNQRVGVIREDSNSLNHRFLFFFLLTKSKESLKIAAGAAQPNLSTAQIKDFAIPVPPLSEQQQIVDRLDSAFAKIDAVKANAEKQLNDAKALFQKKLSKAMTPKEGWERKKLGDIALDMYRGFGIRRDQVTEDGVPCVRYGEIYTTYNVSFDTCISHTKEEFISSPKYFENGDLLFAITGESVEDIGKTIAYLGNERCLLGGDIICMKHEQNPKFLAYALSTTDAIKQKGMGKTKLKVVHTNAPALKAISIPIPPLSEQQAIVTHLDTLLEKLKAVEEKQKAIVAECDAMKQALLREVFE